MTIPDERTYVGGLHAVESVLRQRRDIRGVWLVARRHDQRLDTIRRLAEKARIAVHETDMATLDSMLPDVRHQGCIAVCRQPETAKPYRESQLPALLAAADDPWVLALDQVQDPHNLGACLRSAAAAGVTAVIAPRKRAAGITPAVRKVAVGAVERVPFIPVSNLARAIKRLQSEGFWAVGLAGEAAGDIYSADLGGPVVIVLGGEEKGLRQLTRDTCDTLASIPMRCGMESLNVSVATGVTLFEGVRQRGIAFAD